MKDLLMNLTQGGHKALIIVLVNDPDIYVCFLVFLLSANGFPVPIYEVV